MSIVRAPRGQEKFLVVSNSVAQDGCLTMRALGVLVRLLSRPDNWATNSETLAREFNCGRDQVRGALRELQSAGYIKIQKTQNEKGHWSSSWVVFDKPVHDEKSHDDAPKTDLPEFGKPATGNPVVGFSGPIQKTDLQKTDNKENDQKDSPLATPSGDSEFSEGFAKFWAAWPKSARKGAKGKCYGVWVKAKAEGQTEAIVAHVEYLKTTEAWTSKGGQFIQAPLVYLNQRTWEGAEDVFADKQWDSQSTLGMYL